MNKKASREKIDLLVCVPLVRVSVVLGLCFLSLTTGWTIVPEQLFVLPKMN